MIQSLRFFFLRREDKEVEPFSDDITKAVLSPQLIDDHECRSGRGLNPQPPARQTGVEPNELISWRLATRVILNHITLIWTALKIF